MSDPMNFTGTLAKQLEFQERIYQVLEQDIPFICSTKLMFESIFDPEMYMEYIDKVVSMCRFKGDAGSMYIVYPKNYKFKEVKEEDKGPPANDPNPDPPPKRYA